MTQYMDKICDEKSNYYEELLNIKYTPIFLYFIYFFNFFYKHFFVKTHKYVQTVYMKHEMKIVDTFIIISSCKSTYNLYFSPPYIKQHEIHVN